MQIKSRWLLATAMLVPMLVSTPASADAYYELKIGSIAGSSGTPGYAGWINATSFSWGVTNAGSSAGGGSSRPVFQDFAWTQGGVDASVIPIFLGVATGQHYPTAELDVVRTGAPDGQPQPFFEMIFGTAMLTSLNVAGAGDGETPTASASLDYAKVTMRYRNQLPSGLYGAWIEGTFSLVDNAVTFSGDANVLTGLFESGGAVNLAGVTITPVPEPASWASMFGGLGALAWATRRRASERG